MNKYDDISKKAADKTDADLEDGLKRLETISLDKLKEMTPSVEDWNTIQKLISEVKAAANYNERIAVCKNFMKNCTENAFKIAKKVMFPLLLIMALSGIATAQEGILPTIAGLDLNGVFSKIRAGVFMGFNGDDYASVCAPLISVLGPNSRREYFNLNLGGAKDTGGGDLNFMVSFGWRIDNYFIKMAESKFAQKYLLFSYLPPLEIGPGVSWIPTHSKEIIAGINMVSKFGGK